MQDIRLTQKNHRHFYILTANTGKSEFKPIPLKSNTMKYLGVYLTCTGCVCWILQNVNLGNQRRPN